MTDITDWLDRTSREVGRRPTPEGQARVLLLRRHCPAPVPEVWDACTEPDHLKRWFRPVTGDLRLGGSFHFDDRTGGEILRCEPPSLLGVTWGYGKEASSEVILRLAPGEGDTTALELEHGPLPDEVSVNGSTVDPVVQDAPAGAFGLGARWEMVLHFLERYLRGEPTEDPAQWEASAAGQEFGRRGADAWRSVVAGA